MAEQLKKKKSRKDFIKYDNLSLSIAVTGNAMENWKKRINS